MSEYWVIVLVQGFGIFAAYMWGRGAANARWWDRAIRSLNDRMADYEASDQGPIEQRDFIQYMRAYTEITQGYEVVDSVVVPKDSDA